jgi:hypothetical protein
VSYAIPWTFGLSAAATVRRGIPAGVTRTPLMDTHRAPRLAEIDKESIVTTPPPPSRSSRTHISGAPRPMLRS